MLFNKKINSRYHEGPMAFNETYDTLYFTRNHVSGKGKFNNQGVNNLRIYFTAIKDGKAEKIIDFPLNNSEFSVCHPTFVSKNIIIFVSDMPGGYGGTDLYKTMRVNGVWHPPVNLGSKINTSGNEMFPFIENGILYFSSTGHPGLGGLDIFQTTVAGNVPVKNLGYPVNTNKDDFGFIIRNNKGFFSSNRNGNINNDNIYSFSVQNNKLIYISAKNEEGNILPDVELQVYIQTLEIQFFSTGKKGLSFNWEYGNVQQIKFTKTGYHDQELELKDNDVQQLNNLDTVFVTLNKIEEPKAEPVIIVEEVPTLFKNMLIGQIIELDIRYDVNKANINIDAAEKLDILINFWYKGGAGITFRQPWFFRP